MYERVSKVDAAMKAIQDQNVDVRIELTLEEAKTIARALNVAKSTQGDEVFYRECVKLHERLIKSVGEVILGAVRT